MYARLQRGFNVSARVVTATKCFQFARHMSNIFSATVSFLGWIYTHTSWTHRVPQHWHVSVSPTITEWWQEVSVKRTRGVVGMQEAKHWHQWGDDGWGDLALRGKGNRFSNSLDCHSWVRGTYCTYHAHIYKHIHTGIIYVESIKQRNTRILLLYVWYIYLKELYTLIYTPLSYHLANNII